MLFFDEIDGLVGSRENYNISTHDSRFIAQFNAELTELNNSDNNNIIIIGATNMDLNNPAIIDKAAVNRFKTRIPIDSPNEKQRTAIFKHYLKDDMTDSTNINYKDLISKTKNLSGRDIENICNDAGINAIQRFAKENNIDERYIKPDQFNKIKIKDCDIKIEKDNKKKKEKDLTYL
ncbi:MAG: ATP-binding protein, partial [Candidatus Aenigmarchaeota archaeon]|nr:ATP-binding protein [Candidatus Aenigmarchaeota archaeon]